MSHVNFIADPWEYPATKKIEFESHSWILRYEAFRLRLHWLLLWNDEVHFLDTFPLYNRQLERWVTRLRDNEGHDCSKARQTLFESGAIRVKLRDGFECLRAVDESVVRGNRHFTWYPDGKPGWRFAGKLDSLLHLPDRAAPPYSLRDHKQTMRRAFIQALEPGTEVSREFTIPALPDQERKALLDLVGDNWTRSRVYRVLGFGINGDGKFRRPERRYIAERPHIREQLRKIADACYHRAVSTDLRMPTRFPSGALPLSLDLMFPQDSEVDLLGIKPQESDTLDLRQNFVERAAVCLTGNVGALFRRFSSLTVSQVLKLRDSNPFREFREHYHAVRDKGDIVWTDPKFNKDISNIAVACLQGLGSVSEVKIERQVLSDVRLAPKVAKVGDFLVTGLALIASGTAAAVMSSAIWGLKLFTEIGVHQTVERAAGRVLDVAKAPARECLIYLSAKVTPVSRDNPVRVRVQCAGDISTPGLS